LDCRDEAPSRNSARPVYVAGMLLGFGLPVSGSWAAPDAIRRIAGRAEALGYASLWTFQRVLSPVDAALGPSHESVLDPVLPLAYAAACTERIRLGTATICAPFTAPALLAKTLTSLDVLSGGRLTAGLGMGWLPQEYAAAGVPYERRGARMDEYLRCLQALWTQDPVEFAGEFYAVPRSHVGPRPVQRPHPPVLLGGAAEPALRRAGRLAQGWIASSTHDVAGLRAAIEIVREAAPDPDAVRIVVRRTLAGMRELEELAALGVTEVILDLNLSPGAGDPERVLEAFATRLPPSA
jgi:probable F420-dependent oxidoreductase